MKKIAIDSYYYSDTDCYTVGVIFEDWKQESPSHIISCHTSEFASYIPGEFYKREMPGIQNLLGMIDLGEYDTIILDSYILLDEGDKVVPGLGMHLAEELPDHINLIGVAKSLFGECQRISVAVLRGQAKKPLWIQGYGLSDQEAANLISQMSGKCRIPNLLKILDKETKKYR